MLTNIYTTLLYIASDCGFVELCDSTQHSVRGLYSSQSQGSAHHSLLLDCGK